MRNKEETYKHEEENGGRSKGRVIRYKKRWSIEQRVPKTKSVEDVCHEYRRGCVNTWGTEVEENYHGKVKWNLRIVGPTEV